MVDRWAVLAAIAIASACASEPATPTDADAGSSTGGGTTGPVPTSTSSEASADGTSSESGASTGASSTGEAEDACALELCPTCIPGPTPDAGFFAAVDGSPEGDGTLDDPWDLATAFAQVDAVGPGDTLWVRGGTYVGNFVSVLAGSEDAPVTIRAYPGERVVLDGYVRGSPPMTTAVLAVIGPWSIARDLEILDSSPDRTSADAGSFPTDLDLDVGVGIGAHAKLVNCLVHDTFIGAGAADLGLTVGDVEFYGNIIYHNGWDAPDRGHGHGIYDQNAGLPHRIVDNVLFHQFHAGIHVYGSSDSSLDDFHVEGNIAFENGAASLDGVGAPDLLVGGGDVAERPRVIGNVAWGDGANNVGFDAGCTELVLEDNRFAALDIGSALEIHGCTIESMVGNRFVGYVLGHPLDATDDNEYWSIVDPPRGVEVVVRPNQYEPGRAHVAVLDWDGEATVEADLSGVLQPGDVFEVRDVQDLFAPPLVCDVFTGDPIVIPMDNTSVTPPLGDGVVPPHSPIEFGAFLVRTRAR